MTKRYDLLPRGLKQRLFMAKYAALKPTNKGILLRVPSDIFIEVINTKAGWHLPQYLIAKPECWLCVQINTEQLLQLFTLLLHS
jgi:hypothetical protein